MQFHFSFAMLLLCNLVASQKCNERETECYAPRQCATCLSRRNGRPQTVCSTPRTPLQSANNSEYLFDYCDGAHSMCSCAEKVYRDPVPLNIQYRRMPDVLPPSEPHEILSTREHKKDKEQPGIIPYEVQINGQAISAPVMEKMGRVRTDDPPLDQFMDPPYPFSGVDGTIALSEDQEELDNNYVILG